MAVKLHVGNLAYTTTADTLRAAFCEGGRQVASVSMATGHKNGEPRGFAFVEMATEKDAAAAIAALHQREIDGRAIKVEEARGRIRSRR
jgi:RNA recognition motif-containing protein